ncbi:MAG: GntR family transcriptional regulator, partial [Rhizobiales bacterium]|nr:GntR family transcriptional regulator [Hyphomicrobiales bacterium]
MIDHLSESAIRVERPAKTLRELALDKVRDAIISGYFKPGERLVERDLCAQLGVSRTIVREVLRHLEA